MIDRRVYTLVGVVQGVGFRPYVYNLATKYSLCGYVQNRPNGLIIDVEGKSLDSFATELIDNPPSLANIISIEYIQMPNAGYSEFAILDSISDTHTTTLIPKDTAICQKCVDDINSYTRYRDYFATCCSECGPRYSIILSLPYDREYTSMSYHKMCKSCSSEYSDPTNRRYHTESISCNDCDTTLIGTILECANAIKGGKIVAIKSSGGYHLVCDSGSDSAIMRLREYKRREYKPFAVMIKDISKLDDIADTDEIDKQTLQSLQAPIVIVQKSSTYNLSPLVAPNIDRVGVILPYTPIYHMLYKYIDRPIILTSANIPNEPIIYKDDDVSKLKDIVEYRLSHDIDIQNPTDDSVVQIVDDRLQILRTSRGYAPHVITLDTKSTKRVLALGANQKSTISIAFDRYIITSPYIADLDTIESQDRYKETIDRFIRLYDFVPDVVVCDNHDDYISSKVASEYSDRYDIPLHSIQHHYAHTLSCMSEYRIDTKILAFVFDGNGAGDDGRMWGGEVLIADRYGYERVYHFRYIKLLGISKAIKEPRRVALAILFDTLSLEEIKSLDIPTIDSFSHYEIDMLHKSYIEDISTVDTSSVGRLFDAVSSMCGLSQISSYEAQSGLLVESMYVKSSDEVLEYSIDNGIIDIKIVKYIIKNHDISKLPTLLINTISMIVSDISDRYEYDIVLSGGVWQNKTLMEKTIKSVKNRKIYSNSTTAINDSGISIGQAYWAR